MVEVTQMFLQCSYVGEGQCRATARVQRRLSGAKFKHARKLSSCLSWQAARRRSHQVEIASAALLSMTALINASDS